MVIRITRADNPNWKFDDLAIDFRERMEPYEQGDIICRVENIGTADCPFGLEFAIARDGRIKFRKWFTSEPCKSSYAHCDGSRVDATDAQRNAVADMITGEAGFRGVRIVPGATLQDAVGGITREMLGDTILA